MTRREKIETKGRELAQLPRTEKNFKAQMTFLRTIETYMSVAFFRAYKPTREAQAQALEFIERVQAQGHNAIEVGKDGTVGRSFHTDQLIKTIWVWSYDVFESGIVEDWNYHPDATFNRICFCIENNLPMGQAQDCSFKWGTE